MYCSTCGTQLTAGLSFCNRCGTSLNKERDRGGDQDKSVAHGLIAGIVLVAILGLGAICGAAIALKVAAQLQEPAVVFFMILSFAFVGMVELFMVRQLSRVLGKGAEPARLEQPAQPLFQPALMPASEARVAHSRTVPEPVTSVTENTTRTLGKSFRQS